MGMAVLDEAQRRRRQSVYEFLDATKPACAQALRWCETAREMRRIDGDMKEAAQLLRGALSCVKDYASVYRTWIAMEMDGRGGVGVARWLFEEWGTVCAKDGILRKDDDGTTADEYGDYWCAYLAFELRHGDESRAGAAPPADEYGDYWCAYLAFELRHGDARRARTVATRAVKTCPHDASLRDTVELRLRDAIEIEQQTRHRSGLLRTAKKWLSNVEQSRGCSSLVPRPPQGYRRLLSG
uniref:Crooked neck-like protein 1 n=1 Tax=Aegilops tauschii TaxID=37682 RepID=M8BMA0_AEGTA